MATQYLYNNSWPARGHNNPTLHATPAAAIAAGIVYKGIYFQATGDVDLVDSKGTLKTVKGIAGVTYPVQNFGVVTGGGTTLTTAGAYASSGALDLELAAMEALEVRSLADATGVSNIVYEFEVLPSAVES